MFSVSTSQPFIPHEDFPCKDPLGDHPPLSDPRHDADPDLGQVATVFLYVSYS